MAAPDSSDAVDRGAHDEPLPAPIELPGAERSEPSALPESAGETQVPPARQTAEQATRAVASEPMAGEAPARPAPATGEQAATPLPDAAEAEGAARPRATRIADGAWVGGVCTGLADHLGWPVMVFRIGFIALALVQFVGLVVYALLWLILPPAPRSSSAPGLESHDRTDFRRAEPSMRRSADLGTIGAVVLLAAGLLWLVQVSGMGLSAQAFWPIAFAGVGVALVWRTADSTDATWRESGHPAWLRPFVARGRVLTLARTILGLGLVGAAVGMVIASQGGMEELPRVLAMTGLALAGTALVVAPWAYRSRVALQQAREEKVRADARADMAAHLHDSVLQTLALIQKQSDDPRTVATLARKQERELRAWLYGDVIREKTVKGALVAAVGEVDDERGVPVELVCVGDADLTEELEAMIRAAREAILNAAKHSGAPRVDVYAEVSDDLVEIFVRDRGKGFDVADIGDDRMGVTGSIIGRMHRHGGTARIRSSAQDGTEVRLEMKR